MSIFQLSISFCKEVVDQVFEYPSEDSFYEEESSSSQPAVGQVVPTLSGASKFFI